MIGGLSANGFGEYMARFEYLEPRTLRQAISMMERYGEDARLVAGSTDFLIRWRQGTWQPKIVINLQHISSLDKVSFTKKNGLRLGATATIQDIESNRYVRNYYPALATGATSFAGIQIRNLATIGGNICNASPAGDTLPALFAFGAECRIIGSDGERTVPLGQLITGPGQTSLKRGEILAEIRLPSPEPNTGSIYIKHSPRGAMDIATVGVASVITLRDGGNLCDNVKVALGCVAPTPILATKAEDVLRGKNLTTALIDEAASQAEASVTPIDDIRGSAGYRKSIVGALTKRTLERAIEMAQGNEISYQLQRNLAVQTAF